MFVLELEVAFKYSQLTPCACFPLLDTMWFTLHVCSRTSSQCLGANFKLG